MSRLQALCAKEGARRREESLRNIVVLHNQTKSSSSNKFNQFVLLRARNENKCKRMDRGTAKTGTRMSGNNAIGSFDI